VVPAVMPRPGDRAKPIAPGQAYGAGKLPNATDQPQQEQNQVRPAECVQPQPGPDAAAQPQVQQTPEQQAQTPAETPEPGPSGSTEPASPVAPRPTQAPGITLPFGILIPLPAPQG
jgi:hypothetical protein